MTKSELKFSLELSVLMSKYALEIRSVSKSFKEKVALRDVSIKIPKQSIFGLIGHNGAGKTTLLRIVTQIIQADKGQVLINGEELKPKHRYKIGYLPEERGLYKKMKVEEYLLFLAGLHELKKKEAKEKIHFWLTKLNLIDSLKSEIQGLSKGMQQKVQFIATVFFDPEILILDEPFSGFDPLNVELIKSEIIELNQKGTTVLFSTHQMETIEELCEEISMIHQSQTVLNGSLKEIKQHYTSPKYFVDCESGVDLSPEWKVKSLKSGHEIELQEGQTKQQLLKKLDSTKLNEFRSMEPSLRDVFLKVVQE